MLDIILFVLGLLFFLFILSLGFAAGVIPGYILFGIGFLIGRFFRIIFKPKTVSTSLNIEEIRKTGRYSRVAQPAAYSLNSSKPAPPPTPPVPVSSSLPDPPKFIFRKTTKATQNCPPQGKSNRTRESDVTILNPTYLLDGSNILCLEKDTRGMSLDVLCSITDYLKEQGANYHVYFDATAPHRLRENNKADLGRFDLLIKNDPRHIEIIPARTRADSYLLEEAHRNPMAIILTNDKYEDYFERYPDVLNDWKRRIQPMKIMLDGSIWFERINLSIPLKRGPWNYIGKHRDI